MSFAQQPTLSVVIPTYNRRESLQITLDGLARQDSTAAPFEVVVVSDGSTDGTDEMLRKRADQTGGPYRLHPVVQSNAGPARARNRGVAEATGDIIVFLDDDVDPLPPLLAAHAAHHVEDPNIVIIGPMSPDPQRGGQEPPWIAWEHEMLQKQYRNFQNGVWPTLGPNHFYSGNASVRRSHLLAVGGFDESFTRQEDVELAVRLQRERGVRFVFEPRADCLHRPNRTFESWLKVPYAYGRLDVVRARRGDVAWDVVRNGYQTRSLPTRLLASFSLAVPPVSKPSRALLLAAAKMSYRLGMRHLALGALSVIYNVRYVEAARDELGSRQGFQKLLTQSSVTESDNSQQNQKFL